MSLRFRNHADRALDHAMETASSGRQYAADALHRVGDGLHDARDRVTPLMDRTASHAGDYARRGVHAVREGSLALRDKAYRASDSTVGYIKDEPIKAILVAAAAGAAIAAIVGYVRSRGRY